MLETPHAGSRLDDRDRICIVAIRTCFIKLDRTINTTDTMADEISASLQALVGTAEETAPKAEPRHPINDTTTSKFANLQFGRNYGTGRIG